MENGLTTVFTSSIKKYFQEFDLQTRVTVLILFPTRGRCKTYGLNGFGTLTKKRHKATFKFKLFCSLLIFSGVFYKLIIFVLNKMGPIFVSFQIFILTIRAILSLHLMYTSCTKFSRLNQRSATFR